MRLDRERTESPPGLLVRPAAAGDTLLPATLVIHELWGPFFNDTRSLYRPDAARDARARTLAFFAERLAA